MEDQILTQLNDGVHPDDDPWYVPPETKKRSISKNKTASKKHKNKKKKSNMARTKGTYKKSKSKTKPKTKVKARMKLSDEQKKINRRTSSKNYYNRMKSNISIARKKKRQRANIDKCIEIINSQKGMRVEQVV